MKAKHARLIREAILDGRKDGGKQYDPTAHSAIPLQSDTDVWSRAYMSGFTTTQRQLVESYTPQQLAAEKEALRRKWMTREALQHEAILQELQELREKVEALQKDHDTRSGDHERDTPRTDHV